MAYTSNPPVYNIEHRTGRSEHEPRFTFLSLFSTNLASGGYMTLKKAGCQDGTLAHFFLSELRKKSNTFID